MYTKEALLGWVVLFITGLFWRMRVHLAHVVLVPMWPIAICLSEEDAKCNNAKANERFQYCFFAIALSHFRHLLFWLLRNFSAFGDFKSLMTKKKIKCNFVFETNFNDIYDCSAIQSVRYSVKILFCMQHARERGVNIELQLRWFLLMVKRIKYWYSLLFDNNSTNKFSFCFMCYSYITSYTGWVLRPFIFFIVYQLRSRSNFLPMSARNSLTLQSNSRNNLS